MFHVEQSPVQQTKIQPQHPSKVPATTKTCVIDRWVPATFEVSFEQLGLKQKGAGSAFLLEPII